MKPVGKFGGAFLKNPQSEKVVIQRMTAGKMFLEKNILEPLAGNIVVAYGLNCLRTGYLGHAIRVRRVTDHTEKDIGFDARGYLNLDALNLFLGGGAGHVAKWYDQSGNKQDAYHGSQGGQPQIDLSGAEPAVNFNGTTQFLKIPDHDAISFGDGVATELPFSFYMKIAPEIGANGRLASKGISGTDLEYELSYNSLGNMTAVCRDLVTRRMGRTTTTPLVHNTEATVVWTNDGSRVGAATRLYKDAVRIDDTDYSNGGASYTAMSPGPADGWMARSASYYLKGLMKEFVIFNKELTQAEINILG
ncbi:MAG: hypothetical protein ACTSXQ_00270 [Alphaproteobacteria bacterium]